MQDLALYDNGDAGSLIVRVTILGGVVLEQRWETDDEVGHAHVAVNGEHLRALRDYIDAVLAEQEGK